MARSCALTGYGLANVELDVPATPATVFQTGSVGKQFTAMAVMMLVDEGKLGLDDHISRFFPGAPATWQDITVRHLLTHTSGIKDWEGKTDIDYRRDYTEDELVQVAMKLAPDFAPGTQWSYSNTGYVLLGILVHKVSGKFYGDFLAERVFKPLGMSVDARHQRVGHREEPGRRLHPRERQAAEPGMGLAVAQYHGRRLALHHGTRHGEVGRRPRRAPIPAAVELRGDVVTGQVARWHDLSLWVRVVPRRAARRAGDPARRLLAGLPRAIARYPWAQAHASSCWPTSPKPSRAPRHRAGGAGRARARLARRACCRRPIPIRRAPRDCATCCSRGRRESRLRRWRRDSRNASAGKTARDMAGREDLQQQLAQSRGFTFLAEDDERGRGLELRGEKISRVVFYFMPGERDRRFRFFLNDAGEVAEFSSEPVD